MATRSMASAPQLFHNIKYAIILASLNMRLLKSHKEEKPEYLS